MSAVELRKINKDFSSTKVIDDVDLSIHHGEFLVLVGPSGCGKSTLLRMIAGLEKQTSGNVLINGKNVDALEPMKRNISMVFQNYALYPHFNIEQNLGFGLKLAGVAKKEICERVKKTADILQIQDLLLRKPKELSGGQRQRVALGRALVRNSSIILFDEPLSNLDAHLRSQMRYEIKRLHQLTKSTMVYVTHDQTEATTLGDRIAIIHKGKIVQIDNASDIYQKPNSIFVASFIGSPEINLIPGHLLGLSPDILCGIRPENIYIQNPLGHGTTVGQSQTIQAVMDVQEYLGAQFLVHAKFSEGLALRILSQTSSPVGLGKTLNLSIDLTKMIRFDKKTGQRLQE